MPILVAAVAAASIINGTYLLVFTIVGILTLLGLIITGIRYLRKQGIRDEKLDTLIGGPEVDGSLAQFRAEMNKRQDAQDAAIAGISKEVTPNGENTRRLGDTAARTEKKVDAQSLALAEHIGASAEVHKAMWQEIRTKV